jgi:O-acetyl-ADP-ribose deacetylase (regulator of RNase III)
MRTLVKVGDVLDEEVDILICTANPMLRMTGGVNGALLARGAADVQAELEAYLAPRAHKWVPAGTVLATGPGPLPVRAILHAVSVDGFYRSDEATVCGTLAEALRQAAALGARSVATPALATGYGPLSMEQFAAGARGALADAPETLDEVRIVLRRPQSCEVVSRVLGLE